MLTLAPLAIALAVGQAPAQNPPDAPPAQAQAVAAGATVLSLDEALRLADERNLDLKASAARLRQAQEATAKAWAGYLPSVVASGSVTRNQFEAKLGPIIVDDPQGGTITVLPVEAVIQPRTQVAGQIEANQLLFSPSLFYGIRAASRGVDVAEWNTTGARRDILFGTAQAFYGVASLRQSVQVSEQLLEIAQRQEKDSRVRYQAGAIAKVGLLRAEIDRARAEQDLRRARNSYESARIGLATLLDRPVDFEVADPPEPALPGDAAQLEADALRDRAEVRAARSALESARAARQAQVGKYFPNVGAFARWQIQNAAGFTGEEDQWAVGLGLTWTLVDGGLRESDLREARARVEEAEANLGSADARVRTEVRQALLDLESARANAVKAKEQRDLAAENLRLVDVSYRAGAATAVELADATAVLRNAEIGLTSEGLGAQLAALRVLRAAGRSLR